MVEERKNNKKFNREKELKLKGEKLDFILKNKSNILEANKMYWTEEDKQNYSDGIGQEQHNSVILRDFPTLPYRIYQANILSVRLRTC